MKRLVNWLMHIAKCIAEHLPEGSYLQIDNDRRRETQAVMQTFLSSQYQEVRTLVGDLEFKRGRFSYESGYWDDDYWGKD
jgi:hypothetical protein